MRPDKQETEQPTYDVADVVRKVDADLRESSQTREQLQFQTWRGLAGAQFDRMFASPENAVQFLSDADPKLRLAALSLLSRHYGLGTQLRDQWDLMAHEDSHPDVRLSAKLCLVRYYRENGDPRGKQLLAETVKDSTISNEVRLSLYIFLLGFDDVGNPAFNQGLPDRIDWDVVDKVLNGGVSRGIKRLRM